MAVSKGSISIHAQNIMPIIKRWLYSDKDIFIRELVSNGCDAIVKQKMVAPETQSEPHSPSKIPWAVRPCKGCGAQPCFRFPS